MHLNYRKADTCQAGAEGADVTHGGAIWACPADSSGTAFGAYVSGKYAYVADHNAGFQVIDINGAEFPTLLAGSIEAGTLNATENIIAGGDIYAQGGLHVGLSGIYSRGPLAVGSSLYVGDSTAVGSDPICWDGSGGSLYGDCSSLGKWKTNVEPYEAGLSEILSLEAVTFDWKRNEDGTLTDAAEAAILDPDTGFIADQQQAPATALAGTTKRPASYGTSTSARSWVP